MGRFRSTLLLDSVARQTWERTYALLLLGAAILAATASSLVRPARGWKGARLDHASNGALHDRNPYGRCGRSFLLGVGAASIRS